jgi:hypothetical protein
LAQGRSHTSQADTDEQSRGGGKDPSEYDYEMYELLDRMNRHLPQHSTLFDLLNVSASASSEEISRQFRKLSFQYHPDKAGSNAKTGSSATSRQDMFALYAGASEILKSPLLRARYEWLINQAPPWHRSQVYLWHKLRSKQQQRRQRQAGGGPEISLIGAVIVLVGLLTVAQLILQWVRFGINRYWIWSGSRALRAIPAKEVRRMERKAMRNDLTYLAYVDTNFESMAAAQTVPLPVPLPTDLFVFAFPLLLVSGLWSRLRTKLKKS